MLTSPFTSICSVGTSAPSSLKTATMWRGDYATYNVEFVASSNTRVQLVECNGAARPKFSGGGKSFDFKASNSILFGTPSLKAQNDKIR